MPCQPSSAGAETETGMRNEKKPDMQLKLRKLKKQCVFPARNKEDAQTRTKGETSKQGRDRR